MSDFRLQNRSDQAFDLAPYLEPDGLDVRVPAFLRLLSPLNGTSKNPGIIQQISRAWQQTDCRRTLHIRESFPLAEAAYVYPRGVPWTAYPLWSAPHFRYEADNDGSDVAFAVLAGYSLDDDMEADYRYQCGWMLSRMLQPGDTRPVWLVNEDILRLTTPQELMQEASANQAFRYSYHLNTVAIVAKAVRAALDVPIPPECTGRVSLDHSAFKGTSYSPWVGKDRDAEELISWMCDPYVLQFLYALRRAGGCSLPHPAPRRKASPGTVDHRKIILSGSCLASSVTGLAPIDHSCPNPLWAGSGRYPAVPLGDRLPLEAALVGAWLIGIHDDVQLALTARGERLLDLLHPDCEDPDVLCRWRKAGKFPDGRVPGGISAEHAASAEGWTMRHFRKAKASINAKLRNSTPHEAPGLHPVSF